jgi:glutathione S-transferase
MPLPNPLRLIGAVGSPYTRKMLALLRYRRIPHSMIWADAASELDKMGIDKPKPTFLPTVLFEDETGEAQAVCDSTPIIERLEADVSTRSVMPNDPALAFINYLLEDYGDEWCTKLMFHYRWHFDADADNAGAMLPLTLDVGLADESLEQFKSYFSERQIGRLGFVGSNPTTAPIIDSSYRRLLGLLDAHFKTLPFLLGHKPSSGDFALYGQLSQLVGFDPTPRAIAYDISPRTVGWTNLMEDQGGLDSTDKAWSRLEALPPTLIDILGEIGRTYVPALLANAKALEANEKQWQTNIDGAVWAQQSFPYQGKCLHWIRERYQSLSNSDQQRIAKVFQGTGCEALLG